MTCRVLGRSFRSLAWRYTEWKFIDNRLLRATGLCRNRVRRSRASSPKQLQPFKGGGIEDRIAAPLAELAHANAASGRRAEARQALKELLARSKTGHVSKYLIATVYAALGDKNEALTRLEQAYSEVLGFSEVRPRTRQPAVQAAIPGPGPPHELPAVATLYGPRLWN